MTAPLLPISTKEQTRRTFIRDLLIVGVFIGVPLWVIGYISYGSITLHSTNNPNRIALSNIHRLVNLGDSYSTVLTTYWNNRTENLQVRTDSPTGWSINMPTELGSEWYLFLEFDKATGKVTSVKMRTGDGPAPKDGPPDK